MLSTWSPTLRMPVGMVLLLPAAAGSEPSRGDWGHSSEGEGRLGPAHGDLCGWHADLSHVPPRYMP